MDRARLGYAPLADSTNPLLADADAYDAPYAADSDADSDGLAESLLLGPRAPAGGHNRGGLTSSSGAAAAAAAHHPDDARWRALASSDLDAFLGRVYRYWDEKGWAVIATARLLNLAALAFTAAFSALALLCVRWGRLGDPCIRDGSCDIADAALDWHPFSRGPGGRPTPWTLAVGAYLGAFGLYWCGAAAHVGVDLAATAGVARFYASVLGLSERQLRAVPWAEVARRIVEAQRAGRLALAPGGGGGGGGGVLSEADIVSRIMRRDNYLIALLGAGVLALTPPRPGPVLGSLPLPACLAARGWGGDGGAGARLTVRLPPLGPRRPALPRVLEWNLRACVLDPLFGGGDTVRPDVAADPVALAARFRRAALLNAAAAPFAALFLVTWGFMRHAERFYHHPSSAAARRWSPLAYWAVRELNELPHYADHRLAGAGAAADWYVAQFPAHAAGHVARFVAFVAGSAAALLLLATALEDFLLERPLYGRHVVWWVAGLGLVLAAARGVAGDGPDADGPRARAPEPERALAAVCAATHHRPRHWRGRAHAREVRTEIGRLFRYRAALFAEEVAAVLLAPALLWWALPSCAPSVCAFVRASTVRVPGVGDVVDLAAWDEGAARRPPGLGGGGAGGGGGGADAEAGSPPPAPPPALAAAAASRSRAGKRDKSIVSFAAAYPTWSPRPGTHAAALLAAVAARVGGGGGSGGGSRSEAGGPAAAPAGGAGSPDGMNPLAAAVSAWPAWAWAAPGAGPPTPPEAGKAGGGPAGPPGAANALGTCLAPAAADDHGRIALSHLALQALADERDAAARRGEVAWPVPAAGAAAAAAAAPVPVAGGSGVDVASAPARQSSAPRPTPGSPPPREAELAAVASWSGEALAAAAGRRRRRSGSSPGGPGTPPAAAAAGAAAHPPPPPPPAGDPGLPMPPPVEWGSSSGGSGSGAAAASPRPRGVFGPPDLATSGEGDGGSGGGGGGGVGGGGLDDGPPDLI